MRNNKVREYRKQLREIKLQHDKIVIQIIHDISLSRNKANSKKRK